MGTLPTDPPAPICGGQRRAEPLFSRPKKISGETAHTRFEPQEHRPRCFPEPHPHDLCTLCCLCASNTRIDASSLLPSSYALNTKRAGPKCPCLCTAVARYISWLSGTWFLRQPNRLGLLCLEGSGDGGPCALLGTTYCES